MKIFKRIVFIFKYTSLLNMRGYRSFYIFILSTFLVFIFGCGKEIPTQLTINKEKNKVRIVFEEGIQHPNIHYMLCNKQIIGDKKNNTYLKSDLPINKKHEILFRSKKDKYWNLKVFIDVTDQYSGHKLYKTSCKNDDYLVLSEEWLVNTMISRRSKEISRNIATKTNYFSDLEEKSYQKSRKLLHGYKVLSFNGSKRKRKRYALGAHMRLQGMVKEKGLQYVRVITRQQLEQAKQFPIKIYYEGKLIKTNSVLHHTNQFNVALTQ